MSGTILPGATIGVLGGGQLGRMFTLAARRLGYRVHVLAPEDDTPAGQVADVEVRAAFDDPDAVAKFAKVVDVVTFEFENVPLTATQVVERYAPVRPNGSVLHTTQNRVREKLFLASNGLPIAPYETVTSRQELLSALNRLGYPSILKTASWGYDGHGQIRIESPEQVGDICLDGGTSEWVLEKCINFQQELSVIVARGTDGLTCVYGPIANIHRNHVLDISVMPVNVDASVAAEACEIAETICRLLNVVGVLCIEFFLSSNGELRVNELAPRPHNSGHLTIDACITCQFEQQVRSICGLTLGAATQTRPAAMANLLGELWGKNTPPWEQALAEPEVKLHLYGKTTPRIGRKMGHLTALADTPELAQHRVRAARHALHRQDWAIPNALGTPA